MSACSKKQNEILERAAMDYFKSGSQKAKESVTKAGEALVFYYATLYSPGKVDEDLKQAGFEGLLKALNRFDPNQGNMFSTYASHCIIGEIRHDLRDRGPFKVPEVVKSIQAKVVNATEELAQKNHAMPSLKEIAWKVNISEEGIIEAMQVGCVSLDEVELSKVKHLRYENFKLPIEDRIAVQMSLEKMDKLQKKAIKLVYYEGLTQEQAAKRLGLNQRKVSRLLQRGIEEMRMEMI